MKVNFKPLAMAAAVAAASAGYTGITNAQLSSNPSTTAHGIGDLAIIPYYTVGGTFQTGIHIINTSNKTQVVKLRFRRATDSMDALDINVVMSPYDEWVGNLNNSTGEFLLTTDDKSCTVPEKSAGKPAGVFAFPDLYAEGAEEGYIEVIAMGSPYRQESDNSGSDLDEVFGEETAIAQAAKHVSGVPRDCGAVRENFFSKNDFALVKNGKAETDVGNLDHEFTVMDWWEDLDDVGDSSVDTEEVTIEYEDSRNPLRVSYFLRDDASGLEFGNEAIHIVDFLGAPAMTNQQFGLFGGDISGFDYPDLNGGVPTSAGGPLTPANADSDNGNRARFQQIRNILGVSSVLNDWSTASERNVSTDWVVTFPGQYTMTDYYLFAAGPAIGAWTCPDTSPLVPACDFRDLPITAELSGDNGRVFDREEGQIEEEGGELVVSPSVPGAVVTTQFKNEVNVIQWTDGVNAPVLDSNYAITVDTSDYAQPYGWAQLSVKGRQTALAPRICDWDGDNEEIVIQGTTYWHQNCTSAFGGIPMVGFVAWERSFPSNPAANYGRIIQHASTE